MKTFLRSKQNRAKRRGAVMVEGAIVLGIFLTFLFGMLELSLAVTEFNTLSLSARHLARQTMVRGTRCAPNTTTWGPGTIDITADQNHAVANVVRPLLVTMNPQSVNIKVEWLDASTEYDNRIKVTVKAKHQSILPMLAPWFVNDMQAVSIMRIAH